MHARLYLYVTFGHQGIQAALHICNIRPLKVNRSIACPGAKHGLANAKLVKVQLPLHTDVYVARSHLSFVSFVFH